MTYKSLKMIAVSEENYLTLKGLGRAGDSFNDVITEMLTRRATLGEPECSNWNYHVGARLSRK
jgi:predicted CopG family antitoxin